MALPFLGRGKDVIGSPADDAFYLGRYWVEESGFEKPEVGPKMQMPGTEPVIVCGANRSGKDAGIGNYNGLRLRGRSMVYVDPRGEAGAICGPYRRTLGPTYNWNPFGVLTPRHHSYVPGYEDLESDGINTLRMLDAQSSMLFDDVSIYSNAWIRLETKDPHWSIRSRALWTGLSIEEVQAAAAAGRVPLYSNVRAALAEPDEFDEKTGEPKKGLVARARRLVQQSNLQIRDQLGSFTVDNDETRGVRATADGQTQALVSYAMRDDELKAGVPLDEFGTRPMTLFAILPHDMVQEGSLHANALRLVISAALRSLYRPSNTVCTFWLNEFAALGRLSQVESAIGLVAGYGIQLVIVVQSLVDLHQIYETGFERFLGNAAATVLVGAAPDKFTADYFSSRSGERTILTPNAGFSINPGGFGMSAGEAYTRRAHLMPQDLYRLQRGFGYVWVRGLSNAIPAYFPPYWDVEQLAKRARRNPYYRG
jgi:type IV secretion system protein VirD4